MKKRVLSLLVVFCMCTALVFTGCSSKKNTNNGAANDTSNNTTNDASGNDSNAAGSDAQATSTPDNTTYPVIRMNYAVVFGNQDEQAVEDALNKIMREKAGAEVDLVGIQFGDWSTQMNLMLTGGDNSLDLFTSFWYTSLGNLVANGQVMPIDDLLASDGQGIADLYKGSEDYLNCAKVNGKLYGVPSVYAWCSQNEYIVQKADSEAANIDWSKVTDLKSLTDAMVAMKKANPDKYFVPGSTEPYWIPKSIDYLGDTNYLGVLTDPTKSTTIENFYESKYFTDFLNQVKIWKENDLISPDPLSNSNPSLANLQMGITDGTPGYNWDAQIGINNTAAQNNLQLTGGAITEPLATSGDVTTYLWHISSFCKNPQAAMRVLNVLYTDPEAAQLVANGIEGKDYVLNDKGQMEYPEGKGLPDIGWAAASMPVWPNVTLCKTWSFEPADIYDQMKAKNAAAQKSLALGFQFDSTPVADQVTACANVVAQYYAPLMDGEAEVETTLPEFQKALKDAGIDAIIAEKQKQLDAWLAAKNAQ